VHQTEHHHYTFRNSAGDQPRIAVWFTVVFIHGGYWQARAKENFSFLANDLLTHGLHVAKVGYTLAQPNNATACRAEPLHHTA
jgi:acetyl esterase/lipase